MAWRGQLSRNLKELRVLYCGESPASATTRHFLERNYRDLKTLNPKFPILIRECTDDIIPNPQLWARYDRGVERHVNLGGLTEAQITEELRGLVEAGPLLKA